MVLDDDGTGSEAFRLGESDAELGETKAQLSMSKEKGKEDSG